MMPRTAIQDKWAELHQLTEELAEYVEQAAKEGQAIHEVEQGLLSRVMAMGRRALGCFLEAQGTGDLGESVTLLDGQVIRRLETRHQRPYRSIFGDFDLERTVYGTRETQKIEWVPLDQRLALPESDYSYVLQEWSQALGVEQSFGKVHEFLQRMLKLNAPVDSLERMNRQMAQAVGAFRDSRPAPDPDEEGAILVLSADNKGIPMRRPADRVPTGARRKKGEKANKKQMATVGCAYTVEPKYRTPAAVVAALFRESPAATAAQDAAPEALQKRIWSSLTVDETRGQDAVFAWLASEAALRRPAVAEVVALMDGQVSLWHDRRRYLTDPDLVEILDLLHVTSRVWEAAHLFHAEGSPAAAQFARDRIERILEGQVGYVIGGLRQMATKRKLGKSRRRKLDTICGYFQNNRQRMRYDDYLVKGYPLASGVIEGACRYVVKDRMERAGMRWTAQGAQAMLDLRTTYVNGQWDDYQAWRIDQETRRLYPHQNLLETIPWSLVA